MNIAASNILSNVFHGHLCTFLLRKYLGVEFLGVCLILSETAKWFCKVVVPFYTQDGARGFRLCHILSNTCYSQLGCTF